jgi:hypothetical protein
VSPEEASMPTDRVRTVMAVLFVLSLFLGSLAGCGGGGGSPGQENSPIKLQAATSGSLTVAIANLPLNTPASVRVAGPSNYTADLPGTQTLEDVPAGDYTVTALPVVSGATTWLPTPPTQTVTVSTGATATVTVNYAPPAA